MEIVPGPDFPTGGIICGRDGIVDGYTHRPRADHAARQDARRRSRRTAGTQIIIDEIPYGVIRKNDRRSDRRVR